MTKEELTGGNSTPVHRLGNTVVRESGPWTPAVHAFLAACKKQLGSSVPQVHGTNEEGKEVLSYLPGEMLSQTEPDVLWSEPNLIASAKLLREIHDAGANLAGQDLSWRQEVRQPREVICHNDFAPYNLVVTDGVVSGAIDFDMASPGPRIWDFAYLAYRLAPFAEDARSYSERKHGSKSVRLNTLIAAYGIDFAVREVLVTMAERLIALAVYTEGNAASTGRSDLLEHAAMYRRDAERLRSQQF